ncbi:hypothetical protein ABZY68_20045 [Streptomyces sp. NPDC006482]|uniref:hypothetical protein n=1 Tax=Streptomyces sp. NPDC006482 TaxID=3154306 RepID=UPI0033BB398E
MTGPWTPLSAEDPLGGMRALLAEESALLGYEPQDGYEDRCWVLHTLYEDGRPVRWSELFARSGHRIEEWRWTLSYLMFEDVDLPDEWDGPSGGEIDRDCLARLVELLARHSSRGADEPVRAAHAPIESPSHPLRAWRGRLGDAVAHFDARRETDTGENFPANWWAEDGSWFVLTDWDLSATEVFGGAALVAALLADPGLEAVRHPPVSALPSGTPRWPRS